MECGHCESQNNHKKSGFWDLMMWEGKIQQYMFEVNFFDSRGIFRMLINFPPFFQRKCIFRRLLFAVMLLDYQMTSGYPVGIPKQSHEMLTQLLSVRLGESAPNIFCLFFSVGESSLVVVVATFEIYFSRFIVLYWTKDILLYFYPKFHHQRFTVVCSITSFWAFLCTTSEQRVPHLASE